jgi:hypothetical protein
VCRLLANWGFRKLKRRIIMKKTLVTMMIAMTITVFTCSVWAGELPTVKMEGSVAKFPKNDNVPDVDLSKVSIGRGFNNVPAEFKFMLGKWWRGESVDKLVWYVLVNRYENNTLGLLMTNGNWNKGKTWFISCAPEGDKTMKCVVLGANQGSGFASLVYILSQKNGLPILELNEMRLDFREAGDISKDLFVN